MIKTSSLFLSLILGGLVYCEEFAPSLTEEIPMNPAVKVGKLENGFTYYIQENGKPENRVEMRLVVNAGSILEDDDQLGFAHFCEHMAFNGTENFDENELVSFLQTIGVRFGPDINAYTSFDETVYMLTIPTDKEGLLEKGFSVMKEWAAGVTFAPEMIDAERGVIEEEWRMGRGASQRMRDKVLPVLLKDSRYAERLPIGELETIREGTHEALVRFYKDWYRPDLMALIIVGDIEVNEVEDRIRDTFSDLASPDVIREREVFKVPEHEKTLVSIATDSEATQTVVQVYQKFDRNQNYTVGGFIENLKYTLFVNMLNTRLAELTQQDEPPFVSSRYSFRRNLTRNLETFSGQVWISEDGIEQGLSSMLREGRRALEKGFTKAEFERAKANLLSSYERRFSERDKTSSSLYASQYLSHFLRGVPAAEIGYFYEIVKRRLETIKLQDIAEAAGKFQNTRNRVFVITGPEEISDEISEQKLREVIQSVDREEIQAYVEDEIGSELLAEAEKSGAVISSEWIESIDTKHIVLSNGVNVYLKRTDFRNDEVVFQAYSDGGKTLTKLEDKYSVSHADAIQATSGLGDFSAMDLGKYLAGKKLRIRSSIGPTAEAVRGVFRPEDIKEFFQLLNLTFTAQRKDETAFESFKRLTPRIFRNTMNSPSLYFRDKYIEFYSQGHPRTERLARVEDVEKVDHNRVFEIYNERFADANDFIFVFVGSFEEEELIPMLEQYVATLPVLEGVEKWIDHGIRPPEGRAVLEVYRGKAEKSITILEYWKEIEFSEERRLMLRALSEYINIRLNEVLREEMGEVYSLSTQARLVRTPWNKASLKINIPSAPENVDELVSKCVRILEQVSNQGISEDYVKKVREIMKRAQEVKFEKNDFWVENILQCVRWNRDFEMIDDLGLFDGISSEAIQRVFNECFEPEKYLRSTLYPESMKVE